jgi:hypothetical protein
MKPLRYGRVAAAALGLSFLCGGARAAGGADPLAALAADFWSWRAATQPASGDDIPRLDRPAGWVPDWSAAAVALRTAKLAELEARWRALDLADAPVARRVDHRLIGSALARVRWELEVAPGWRRNPLFYVDQTLGSLFELLILPRDLLATQGAGLVARLDAVPATVAAARANLDDARAPFARLAVAALAGVELQLEAVARELVPVVDKESAQRLPASARAAAGALGAFRGWLSERLPSMREETAVGREAYVFFLSRVALLPWGPERLVEMGRQEWERAVAFEALEANRRRDLAPLPLPASRAEQIAAMEREMVAVRDFLGRERIQNVPAWVRFYRLAPMPPWLEPLAWLGVDNDFTGPGRLDQDGHAWIREPSPDSGYFYRAYATDPRTQVAHESHGHYLQLVLAWAHEDPIRRRYYDSGANEGIAFYNEELMLQAGLFDADRPQTRATIYSFARLRALRVEVDVRLATGELTIEEAAALLRDRVPMDEATARDEAAFFASAPGQAISYQIGKLQILRNLAAAKQLQGARFDLVAFHDFLWKNGNVPLALQRWELLGLADDLAAADGLR